MPSLARAWAGSRVMSRPPKVIVPARAGRSPMIVSMVVVLPAPLRPTRQTASASPTRRETARSTCAGPRKVSRPLISSMLGLDRRADEGGRHRVVAADLVGGAVGEDGALVHGHDAVGIAEDHVHVVLDDHGRDAARAH